MLRKQAQSGQIAIVILLIMVVLLTISLSLASRTTEEIFLSQQEAESARVFNAAESGIEDALSQDFSAISGETALSDVGITDVTTNTTIFPQTTLETQTVEGKKVHIDLAGNSGGDTITINWSKNSGCDNSASLVVSTYYDDGGTVKAVHEAFGPELPCTSPRDADEFSETVAGSGSGDFVYGRTITLPDNPITMRVSAVYMDTPIQITGTVDPQFFVIRAEADNDLGEENRVIEVGRGLSAAPAFMDYAVYSGGALAQ